jgi:hypothetical protein
MAKRVGARLVWSNRYRNAKSTLRPLSCKQSIADEASAAILSSILGHSCGAANDPKGQQIAVPAIAPPFSVAPPYFSAPRIWPVVSR